MEISSSEGTTQGDPIAMPCYAIGILPLLSTIKSDIQQVAFADDLTGAGKLSSLKVWWNSILEYGPYLGYYAKPTKSWLIIKDEYMLQAEIIFHKSGLNITSKGRKHLGAVIGSENFKSEFVESLVDKWVGEISKLCDIAKIEPHVAYSSFTHGLQHRYTYFMRTIPNISDDLKRLDIAVDKFIKCLVEGYEFNATERLLFSLPTKLGGLGIQIPSQASDCQYENSRSVTQDLSDHVRQQKETLDINYDSIKRAKTVLKKNKQTQLETKLNDVRANLSNSKLLLLDAVTEHGASSWLSALPIKDQGFYLNKQSFFDAIYLRYGIPLRRMPIHCVCGSNYSIEHALSCKLGGFVTIRHNEIVYFTADCLSEINKNVEVEPLLAPLTGEKFDTKSANLSDEARLDVVTQGFWERGRKAFVDVRVFNPLAKSYSNQSLSVSHRRNENQKKREYTDRILQVEHASFTPLVFTCFGGMSTECQMFYKRLSQLISEKRNTDKSITKSWIQTKLSFSLLRTTLLCIRGSRSHKTPWTEPSKKISETDLHLASFESKLC